MNLDEALEKLEQARDKGDQQATANLLFKIGRLMVRKQEQDQALKTLQEAYDICRVMGNDQGRLAVVREVVPLLLALNRPEAARSGIGAGMELALKLSDQSARLDLLLWTSELLQMENNPQEAVKALAQAVDLCREHDDRVGELLVLEKLGPVLRRARQPRAALEVYQRMAGLAADAGEVSRHGLALAGVGQLSLELGRTEQALENLALAEKVYLSAGLKVWADKVRAELDRIGQEG